MVIKMGLKLLLIILLYSTVLVAQTDQAKFLSLEEGPSTAINDRFKNSVALSTVAQSQSLGRDIFIKL